ncbi:unnamed protein product [Calypogeia fissa]
MLPRRSDPRAQHPGDLPGMVASPVNHNINNSNGSNNLSSSNNNNTLALVPIGELGVGGAEVGVGGIGGGAIVPVSNGGAVPRKSLAKAKSSISREEASLLPIAVEGVHWRREEAPPHSKSGSAVTRCLMLTDPSCITFSRRNYLEDHFRVVHKLFPSKPRVGRKKISNKPSRCISPSARERMADHMQGDFPFKFWKAKKKRFVMSTTKAKHMWCSVPGHEKASEEVRTEWVWRKAADFYKIWREGSLAIETMVNLASHVEDYWNGKGIVDEEEVAQRGRIPRKYEEFVSDEEAPTWETNKDGREICRRRLKAKAIEDKTVDTLLLTGGDPSQMRADMEGAESESDDGKDESASTVEDLQSVAHMDASSNLGHQGMAMGGQPGRPGLLGPIPVSHDPGMGNDIHMHRQGPHNSSMHLVGQGRSSMHDGVHGTFTSLLNVVASEDGPEGQHLMSMSSQAMAAQRMPLHLDHREYERQQNGGFEGIFSSGMFHF